MRKSLYLLVLAVALIAGCTQGATTTQNSELLRISGVTVTPGTVVAPGEIITIRMKLDNIGQEDVKFVTANTKNPCYATSVCDNNQIGAGCTANNNKCTTTSYGCDSEKCNAPIKTKEELISILYDHCGNLYNYDTNTPAKFDVITSGFEVENGQLLLKPSRSALLEWTVKAPSETTIANMQQECTFRFQINYQARAETYTYIYFANPDEKNQRTYTNKDMNLRGENVANFGPVYINFETAQDQPIKGSVDINNADKQNKWTLYTTVRNVGDGIGKVVKDSFKIDLPKNSDNFPTKSAITLSPTIPPCSPSTAKLCEVKDCTDFSVDNENKDTLKYGKTDDSRLKLYSKQSSRFSCTLPAPKVDVLEPYRFISSADYVYTIDKELKITTVPKRT